MLVRPGGAQPSRSGHLENGVHLQVCVRVDRLAGSPVDRQLAGIDDSVRVAGHLLDAARQPRQTLSGIQRTRIQVGLLEVDHLDSRSHTSAVRGAGRQQGTVEGVVVVDPGAGRVPAGGLRDQARKRVSGHRSLSMRELDPLSQEPGEC